MPLVAESDTQLVAAARSRDPRAWDTLLKRHQAALHAYVAELVRDRHLALDLVQETFVAAVRHIGSLRDDAKFASWLFGIAHQKCVQQFRKARRHVEFFTDADAPREDATPDDGPDPRDQLVCAEQTAAFFTLVEQLPVAQRSALLLHVLEDFSLEEIAEVARVPVGTIKSRLHHARRALRRLVEDATV
jgi:RNA polymerase sigma-70 factor, ECF subfamily